MGGKPRRRRPADQARAAILDAAEQQLAQRGPAGIRLQEIAAKVGISHPAVLHHFGSRERLVRAVVARTIERFEQDLIATLARGVDENTAVNVLEQTFELLADRKHARTLAWLYLVRGASGDPVGHGVRRIADVVHALRTQHRGADTPPYQDTLFTVTLASFALFGHAIAAPRFEKDHGVDSRQFLRWLTRFLMDHLASAR